MKRETQQQQVIEGQEEDTRQHASGLGYNSSKRWDVGSNRVHPNMDLRGIGLGQASTNKVGGDL